ncbi:hypothetical protein [Metabacillus rhizolycopersici]|uniref:Uncharacterized protein n=1 Tax=Metabacillus rhizolycopersici TaxID=2875709 RepID=A0ABS7UYT7_9BACI|nr:hypothetical protein [Metabacillus rhizolycopersici]
MILIYSYIHQLSPQKITFKLFKYLPVSLEH